MVYNNNRIQEDTLKKDFVFVVTLLKYLGAWPSDTVNPLLYCIYTICMLVFIQIPMTTLPVVKLFMEEKIGVLSIASCIFLNLQIAIVPFTFVSLLVNHKNLLKVVEILDSKVFNSYTEKQVCVIRKATALTKRIYNYVSLVLVTLAILTLPSLTHLEERRLFMEMWFPFNPKENLIKYFSTYIFSVVGLGICGVINSTAVVLTCGLLVQATAQIQILKDNLKNSVANNKAADTYEAITKCIKHYSVIILFVKLIETNLSLVLCLQFLSATVVTCLSAFLLTVTPFQDTQFFGIVFYLCCILIETFLLCHFGEYLRTESSTICDAIYLSNWVDFDRKSRKALIILMQRANVPLKVSPAGLFTLSNAAFTNLIHKAYSFFAVLQQMDVDTL